MHAPLQKNQVVGTINFQLDGKTIEQCLWLCWNKSEGNFFGKIIDYIKLCSSLVWLKIEHLKVHFVSYILSISKKTPAFWRSCYLITLRRS
ncbi:hypothetical protein ACNKHT_04510 [Shigella flexneri]